MLPTDVLTMRFPTLLAVGGLVLGPVLLPGAGTETWPVPAAAAVLAPDTQSAPAAPEAAPLAPAPAPAPVQANDPVIALLDAVEARGRDLDAFRAKLFYETEDALLGQTVRRLGTLLYAVEPTEQKRFAVVFETIIENRRARPRQKRYVYGDGWLVEVDPQEKQFIKRQIAPPGAKSDPLKLGEGPFPLPIGQPRDEVLSRFAVSALPLPESGPLAKLREHGPVDGVRLVPLPGIDAEDILRIDLFYDRETRLPVGIELIETNEDRKTVRLSEIVLEDELDAAAQAELDITEPDPAQWLIDVRPLQ